MTRVEGDAPLGRLMRENYWVPFAASIDVVHFPVHESGGIAWVWLGTAETPRFPDLPFGDEELHRYWCVSRVPCNWLQGIEGSIDSVHPAHLHHTWLAEAAKMA